MIDRMTKIDPVPLLLAHELAADRRRIARAERRRYQRYALRCSCWLEGEAQSIYANTADVGLGGLFLRSAVPIREGLTLDVELGLADGRHVQAGGLVTRSVPAIHGQRFGIGVEFLDIDVGRSALLTLLGQVTR